MSNALAIASLTYILKDLLNNGLIDNNIADATNGNVTVSALPPDMINLTDSNQFSRLNLFMYHATPNQGWRNTGLPSHNSNGQRIFNPPLVLDLHYLLTAYAFNELHSEILLGYGMQLLHENPVLTRDMIRKSLATAQANDTRISITAGTSVPSLPDNLKALSTSALANQVEQIKIVPVTMSTEEMSKLWSAFQSKYRPTAAYMVSVVLIDGEKSVRSPLPVLTRGKPDNSRDGEEGIIVTPNISSFQPTFPMLIECVYPGMQKSALVGDIVVVNGINLLCDKAVLHFENKNTDYTLSIDAEISEGNLSFKINKEFFEGDPPVLKNKFPAGFYSVYASIERAGEAMLFTNAIPFALAPKFDSPLSPIQADPVPETPGIFNVSIPLTCRPYFQPGQKISLFLNDREAIPPTITQTTNTETFTFESVPGEDALLRLRVDGVDSHFIDYSKKPPVFIDGQKVKIS
jgi:hypothetical protein